MSGNPTMRNINKTSSKKTKVFLAFGLNHVSLGPNMKQNFLFPSPDSFSPPNIPILPLVEKFGIYFPNFFLP
jgi:hypothetical protein